MLHASDPPAVGVSQHKAALQGAVRPAKSVQASMRLQQRLEGPSRSEQPTFPEIGASRSGVYARQLP